MMIDTKHSDRYYIIEGDQVINGWATGWYIFNHNGSPTICLEVEKREYIPFALHAPPLLDHDLWPDTKDYDQNNPGILDIVNDLDRRSFHSDLEKAFWVNVTRVPICVSYLAALAKVRPMRILELGTGGDSAHSTGMFLYYLRNSPYSSPMLVSVDRHPLSHVWPRYRESPCWHFIQGDSITVMKKLMKKEIAALPVEYDLIFIDSSHTYPHTLKEIEQASCMTAAMLLDDTTVEDVKKSLDEFLSSHKEWLRIDLAHGVTLIERHDYLSEA